MCTKLVLLAYSDQPHVNIIAMYAYHSAAPSPPRAVGARLVAPYTVEVSWTAPANPNGDIVFYTVYATQLSSCEAGSPSTGEVPEVTTEASTGNACYCYTF